MAVCFEYMAEESIVHPLFPRLGNLGQGMGTPTLRRLMPLAVYCHRQFMGAAMPTDIQSASYILRPVQDNPG